MDERARDLTEAVGRQGKDFTRGFGELAAAIQALRVRPLILDGR